MVTHFTAIMTTRAMLMADATAIVAGSAGWYCDMVLADAAASSSHTVHTWTVVNANQGGSELSGSPGTIAWLCSRVL